MYLKGFIEHIKFIFSLVEINYWHLNLTRSCVALCRPGIFLEALLLEVAKKM